MDLRVSLTIINSSVYWSATEMSFTLDSQAARRMTQVLTGYTRGVPVAWRNPSECAAIYRRRWKIYCCCRQTLYQSSCNSQYSLETASSEDSEHLGLS